MLDRKRDTKKFFSQKQNNTFKIFRINTENFIVVKSILFKFGYSLTCAGTDICTLSVFKMQLFKLDASFLKKKMNLSWHYFENAFFYSKTKWQKNAMTR